MKEKFRTGHILKILEAYEKENIPADIFLSNYFRKNKAIGSKDRKYIAENIYLLIRWKGLIDYFVNKPICRKKRLDILSSLNIEEEIKNKDIPSHVRVSFPKKYFDRIKKDYGEKKAEEICLISNSVAPTVIRANIVKVTREKLFNILSEKYDITKCSDSSSGIIFNKKINFFISEEFKNGFFEVQDEGSQLIAELVSPTSSSAHVLDYCAGSGGKTLAFAHNLQNKGQIYLHDVRERALIEAKKRLKRAGIQNAQIVLPHEIERKIKKGTMDWILLDVPCSGSGTLRRNVDMKWKFNFDTFEDLIETQREIFDKAIPYLKPNGYIVYATCSIFAYENEKQINYFLKKYPFKLKKSISWLPKYNEKDGFFGAILKKT